MTIPSAYGAPYVYYPIEGWSPIDAILCEEGFLVHAILEPDLTNSDPAKWRRNNHHILLTGVASDFMHYGFHTVADPGTDGPPAYVEEYRKSDGKPRSWTAVGYFAPAALPLPPPPKMLAGTDPPPYGEYGAYIVAGYGADILVVAPDGARTGFVAESGASVEEIPSGAYWKTFVGPESDEGSAEPTAVDTSNAVYLMDFGAGLYEFRVLNNRRGLYRVQIRTFRMASASRNPDLIVAGISEAGAVSSFNIVRQSPGLPPRVTRNATFEGMNEGLRVATELGYIRNRGVANSLAQKVENASRLARAGKTTAATNILQAFEAEVRAQAGRHIDEVAAQIYLEDAEALIERLRSEQGGQGFRKPADGGTGSYGIEQNVPNPFNLNTLIRYQLPESGNAHIAIYNLAGQTVRTLVHADLGVGRYETIWDGTDDNGRGVSNGVYVYRIEVRSESGCCGSTKFVETKRMLLLK